MPPSVFSKSSPISLPTQFMFICIVSPSVSSSLLFPLCLFFSLLSPIFSPYRSMYSCTQGLAWPVVDAPVPQTFSHPAISCPELLDWGGTSCSHLLSIICYYVRTELVQVLHMLSQPEWVHICPVLSRKHCFLQVIYCLWFLKSFCSPFPHNPWAPREEVLYRHPCKAGNSKVFHSPHVGQLWASVLISI